VARFALARSAGVCRHGNRYVGPGHRRYHRDLLGRPRPRAERISIIAVSSYWQLGVDSRHQEALVSTVDIMTRTPDLLPGTLDLLILRTLQKEALHGWAISERIQAISEDVLQINQGSLYPALHRLEHQGWLEAEWKVSELGRRAKYYRLTTSGRRQLTVEAREWERMSNAIERVMKFA
jgi:PadR family transcriptional regulator PadR